MYVFCPCSPLSIPETQNEKCLAFKYAHYVESTYALLGLYSTVHTITSLSDIQDQMPVELSHINPCYYGRYHIPARLN